MKQARAISASTQITQRRLTPEEDAILDADEIEVDDLLPADLWFRHRHERTRRVQGGADGWQWRVEPRR